MSLKTFLSVLRQCLFNTGLYCTCRSLHIRIAVTLIIVNTIKLFDIIWMVVLFESATQECIMIGFHLKYYTVLSGESTTPNIEANESNAVQCCLVSPALLSPHTIVTVVCPQILLSHWLEPLFIFACEVKFGFIYNLSNPWTAVKSAPPRASRRVSHHWKMPFMFVLCYELWYCHSAIFRCHSVFIIAEEKCLVYVELMNSRVAS